LSHLRASAYRTAFLLSALAAMVAFQAAIHFGIRERGPRLEAQSSVVMPAAVQVFLYAGDRFLAANVEAIRAVMSGGVNLDTEAGFRLRAHREVSRLNPCHEDNYWIGNGELTWGGSHHAGYELLRNATTCRFWDEWPPFFYGFNRYFFARDLNEARDALNTAAQRARTEANAAAFRTLSVMIITKQFADVRMAIELIEKERDQARDAKQRARLELRVKRLRGLKVLRDAQAAYEAGIGHPLSDPGQLIASGYLTAFPDDPVGLGYSFENGVFQLQVRRHEGLEALRAGN
jgi:hypothetical protein